ncbi:Ger(x)C family spore germination protein [Anaerobranca gottschalkii]|uniref:Spore germination protein KC n=1 Tax=Anaerobranca gottschalkii DSM 13577 TaxID=1120990 RepID=A0A1H9YII8_9FIRM|nr:Ger(x)C family spore germination protein [Anaerobranca gottschalkii]SES68843.1 spore germination protein KC [Anaerobranca gottschalkii DSM 13577]
MKNLLKIILLISLCIINTSCWSKKEIETLGFVMGLGISKTDTGLYTAVVQVANPAAVVAENPDPRDVYTIMKAEGLSVFDALRNLSMIAGRRLYFPHLKVIIIDEKIAKEGISEVLGFLKQDEEIRLESEVLISKLPPEEILDTPNTLGVIPAQVLDTIAENFGANNKIYVADLRETLENATNPYTNYVTGVVEKIPSPTPLEREMLKISKIAIFNNDKLVGYLDYEEGQAYNIITNNFDNGLIVFEDTKGDKYTIEMLGVKTKITPSYKNDKVVFQLDVKGKGNIAGRISNEKEEIDIDELKKVLDQVIKDKINRAIFKAQREYGRDYYNLSKNFYRKYPQKYFQLRDKWDEHFSEGEINVDVDITIIHPALGTYRGTIK